MQPTDLTRFVAGLNDDDALRRAFVRRFGDGDLDVPAADVAAFAREHGYDLATATADAELSESELESVAGGGVVIIESSTLGQRARSSGDPGLQVSYSPATARFGFRHVGA